MDSESRKEFKSLHEKVDKLVARLFIDNGAESVQSRINRHDIWIKRATGIGIGFAIVVSGLCVDAVQEIIKGIIN